MATVAYCWASGLIEFGESVPEGAIPMVSGDDQKVRELMDAVARIAHDNVTLLVPGVPEADDDKAKHAALQKFLGWLRSRGDAKGLTLVMQTIRQAKGE